ncbi:MAG: Uma2 family endonuclease, partial [Bacteroidota bacterium]
KYTYQEYLAMEANAEYKSEFYNGKIYAKSGATFTHSLIGTNTTSILGNALNGKDCLTFNSDLNIRIEAADANAYPDAFVICGPPEFDQGRKHVVTNPTLIVEVLSDGTAAWDRGGKFKRYRQIPSLKEYVLIEQEDIQVEVFRKNEIGFWVL